MSTKKPILALEICTERFLSDRTILVDIVLLEEDGDSYRRVRYVDHPLQWVTDGRLRLQAIPLSARNGGSYDGPVSRYSWETPAITLERAGIHETRQTANSAARILGKLETIRKEEGYAADFAAYVSHLARATGAKQAWLAPELTRAGIGRKLVDVATAVHTVRDWIDDATALGRKLEAAYAAEKAAE